MTTTGKRQLQEIRVWHPGHETYRYHRYNPLTHRHEMRVGEERWRSINTEQVCWFAPAELRAMAETAEKPYG